VPNLITCCFSKLILSKRQNPDAICPDYCPRKRIKLTQETYVGPIIVG